jgi:acetylornithine deacetylase/succinyl-diaminopimelate desuccinylase family protein
VTQPVPDALRAIFDRIDREETIGLARSLVRIPSITGHEGLVISEFMADWLRRAGLQSSLQLVGNERANVIGRLDGIAAGPRLLLNGHLDTKPADDMTIDPYTGDIRDGQLYGRGSCDMKGPVAAEMIAMKALAQSGVGLHGTLLFGSEVGEDGGGWRIDELLEGPCACDIGICGEPSKMDVHLGCRGVFPLTIRTLGRATHTGTAYTGVNAIQKMCSVIPALYALPCFHRVDPQWGRSPINAMIINGGGKVSASVPDECEARFDIRLNPDLTVRELDLALEDVLSRLQASDPELKIEVVKSSTSFGDRVFYPRDATFMPADNPLVRQVEDAVEVTLGHRPRLAGFPGGCSVTPMADHGIPSIIFGPGNLEQAHSVDEWIDVEEIYQAAKVYAAIAFRILAQ